MRIALLPADMRPCTRDFAVWVARVAGVDVVVPPVAILGWMKQPADVTAVSDWLLDVASGVDGVVVSLDMLGHGGLVPSRLGGHTLDQVRARLDLLRELRRRLPHAPIYGFIMVTRQANYNLSAEEPDYWDEWGTLLHELSWAEDQYRVTGDPEAAAKAAHLRQQIPSAVLDDWLAIRRRNHAVCHLALDLLASGVLDRLVIPQDDCAPYGWPAAEAAALRQRIWQDRLFGRALIYPGADEAALTLVTRMVLERLGLRPRLWPYWAGTLGPTIVARYEDRPLGETVRGHIFAAGARVADSPAEADIFLAVNCPGTAQGEAMVPAHRYMVDTAGRNIPEFVDRTAAYVDAGRLVAVADLAYANGGDEALVEPLGAAVPLWRLAGYAGWNTAGNSAGTVVAHAVMRWLSLYRGSGDDPAHLSFLLHRFADDYLYQARVRQQVTPDQPVADLERQVARLLAPAIVEFHRRHFAAAPAARQLHLNRIYLPCARLFDVGIDLHVTP